MILSKGACYLDKLINVYQRPQSLTLKRLLSKPASMTSHLASARYGKDNVRLYKVHRDPTSNVQTVVEMTVCVLLEGEIDVS